MKGLKMLTFGNNEIFDSRMSIVSKGTGDYHLKIIKMTSSDNGTYTCSDGSGKEIRSYTLNVKGENLLFLFAFYLYSDNDINLM